MPWRRPTERSELVHVVVTDSQKRKYPRKFYVFVIDVTWNNNERSEIYRRYSEFFSFQTTLKALFPDAAGKRSAERTIPQLPKRIFVGRSHVARVAEARVELINRYCQTLVSLDVNISQSSHVIGFFSPRIGDKSLPKLHLHRPASLHPMKIPAGSLFEEYCALAEYQGDDPSQISFTSGQIVLVLDKDNSGWWMCKVNDKVGWAPPSYLKKVDRRECGESDSDDDYLGLLGYVADSEKEGGGTDSGVSSIGETVREQISEGGKGFNVPEIEFQEYKAIDSYEAQGDGQVNFEEGDIIQVLDKIEDGWWFVAKGQEEGWVPCSYLEPLNGGQEEDDTISSLDVEPYVTIERYMAEEDDELSFPKGVTVQVLQKSLDGWWLIKHDGKAALAPATFLVKKEKDSENNPSGGRKPSMPNVAETLVENGESEEKINTLTREFYKQPPRKESVRKRVTIRKSKQKDSSFARPTTNGLKAPPTIREESPSPTPTYQPRKLSLETPDPTNMTGGSPSLTNHSPVRRKLSDTPAPTQEKVEVSPNLPGQKKISLDAALSGAPTISPNGSFVHQLNKATLITSSITSSTTADSDTEEHEYFNIDNTQAYLRERREQKLREMQGKSPVSPTTSDSEVERDSSSSWTGQPGVFSGRAREMQSHIRRWERRLSSDSEEGVSSPTRRPVATPRARKPDLKPKPSLSQQQVPPRPRQSQIVRARGKVGMAGLGKRGGPPPVIEEQPAQPHLPPRPRCTEIRRARQGKPFSSAPNTPIPPTSPSPSATPTITATNDKGDHKVVLSPNSAFRPISNRRSPSPGLAVVREERSEDTGTTPSALGLKSGNRRPRSPRGKSPSRSPSPAVSTATAGESLSTATVGESLSTATVGESLALPKPILKDRHDSETQETPPSPSPSSPSPASSPMTTTMMSSEGGGNPLNQQMAETLIKYVLASQDNGLKNALRECIMSNPEAVKALQQ